MRVPRNVISINPPLGGVSRKLTFQKQPPYTAYQLTNFWPLDHKTGRQVLATRPRRRTRTWPGGSAGTRINMLLPINGVRSAYPVRSMICAKDGQIYVWDGSTWVAATGAQAAAVATGANPVYGATFLQTAYIAGGASNKPIAFNYATGAAAYLVESAGTVPNGLSMFAVWQGALWAAGDPAAPNVLYASRVGDATDWDFAAPISDTGGAFYTAGEDEGLLRGPVTAVIPHTADTLIVSTSEGMVALYGHPRAGGIIENLSDRVVQGQGAWCKGPDDTTYMMTAEGVVALAAQAGAVPVLISQRVLPQTLGGSSWTPDSPKVTMAYDPVYNGIFIVQRVTTSSATCYWLDLNTGGFWEMTWAKYPLVALSNPAFSPFAQHTTLYGGDDGLTHFEDSLDADETFTATAILGPVPLSASLLHLGKIKAARISFADRDEVASGTIYIAGGADASDAVNRVQTDPQYSISIAALNTNNCQMYPLVSGQAMAMRISQTSGHLVYETTQFELEPRGRNRATFQPPPL